LPEQLSCCAGQGARQLPVAFVAAQRRQQKKLQEQPQAQGASDA